MEPLLVAHLAATSAYAGFQWTVQVLVYRQFSLVPAGAFAAHELAHQRRVSYVVGPLLLAMLATTALLLVRRPAQVPLALIIIGAALLAVVLGVTILVAVPLHARLGLAWDASAHRTLLRWDLLRTVAASAGAAVAGWAALVAS